MLNEKKGMLSKIISVAMWISSINIFFILIYMLYSSLRTRADIITNTLGLPYRLTIENYIRLFVNNRFEMYFFNSVFILLVSLFLIVVLSSMVAYALGRFRFKLNKPLRLFFLLGMMFPIQLGIVPIFIIMRNLNLIDSYLSVILILGSGISMPVFMLTNFFAKLPTEIYEAAKIDGAGEWTIFLRIMFPLAKPGILSVCIINSVGIWNQFFIPLIFLQSNENQTIPLAIVRLTTNLFNTMDLALAASVISTVPVFILFILFSRKIIDGFTAGAVKG